MTFPSRSRRAFLCAATLALSAPLAATAQSPGAPLKIGIVGSGRVGSTLGAIWLKAGHEVMFSSLDLEQDKALAAKLGGKARAGTTREAAAFGDVVMVAVPYAAMPGIGRDLAGLLRGKIVIDTSNPIVARDGDTANWARGKGAGLATAELLPGARIVRTFNAIGFTRMGQAAQDAGRIGMPMAGDDPAAIDVASRLVREIGYEPVPIGGLAMGKYLMPGTPLAGEHTPQKLREIVSTLKE